MHCDKAHIALSEEQNTFALMLHLASCSGCRAYKRNIAQINRVASTLSLPLQRKPIMARSVIGALTVATAVGIGLLIGPRFTTSKSLAASEIHAAILKANTWHFVGWKIVNEKKVKWEIWGRRAPFFYREQLGDDLLIDNGKTRLRLLSRTRLCPKSYAILLPSSPLSADPSLPKEHFFEGIGGEYLNHLTPTWDSDPKSSTLTFSSKITHGLGLDDITELVVQRQSQLPLSLRLIKQIHEERTPKNAHLEPDDTPVKSREISAELRCDYNVTLPANLDQAPQDSDIKINTLTTPEHSGLTLKPTVLAQDAEGNVQLQTRAWLGNTLLEENTTPGLNFSPGVADRVGSPEQFQYTKDDQGRLYLTINGPRNVAANGNPIWLVPLEPLTPNSIRPRFLHVPLRASVSTLFEDGRVNAYANMKLLPILTTNMTMTVALPTETKPLPYDNQPTSEGLQVAGAVETLAYDAAMARHYYYVRQIGRNGELKPGMNPVATRNALRWLESGVAEAKHIPKGQELVKRAESNRKYLLKYLRQ